MTSANDTTVEIDATKQDDRFKRALPRPLPRIELCVESLLNQHVVRVQIYRSCRVDIAFKRDMTSTILRDEDGEIHTIRPSLPHEREEIIEEAQECANQLSAETGVPIFDSSQEHYHYPHAFAIECNYLFEADGETKVLEEYRAGLPYRCSTYEQAVVDAEKIALHDANVRVSSIQAIYACPKCDGTGYSDQSRGECATCNGKGQMWKRAASVINGRVERRVNGQVVEH